MFGEEATLHEPPLKLIASVCRALDEFTYVPTALQAEAEVQARSVSQLAFVPLGSETVETVHAEPFHAIARACFTFMPSVALPTAKQVLAPGQATPERELRLAPSGTGVVCLAHTVPFHAAACT